MIIIIASYHIGALWEALSTATPRAIYIAKSLLGVLGMYYFSAY